MRNILAFALSLIVLPTSLFASDTFQISGYYKNFFTALNSPGSEKPVMGAVSNRLRLNLFYNPVALLSLSVACNLVPRVQDASLFANQPLFSAIDASGYRVADLDSQVYPAENDMVGSFGIFQSLDRAFVTLSTSFADMYIGRQAIAWGSSHMLNPTDIIAPFTFDELDTEERIGVDALRVRFPVSAMGEFDTGYIFGKDFDVEKSAFFLRSKFNVADTDTSFLLLEFRENLLAGFDIAGAIGGAGFWLEGAYVFVKAFDDDETLGLSSQRRIETSKKSNYFRGSIGLDYSFSGNTYGFIEYHFSQAGAKKAENYLTNLNQPAYTDGTVYLLGKHYFAPSLMYQITPLITFNGQMLFNLSDTSMFLSSQIEYNIAQDIYVSAGAFIGIGKSPEIGRGDARIFHSEFGGYPDIYFSSFRIYF